MSKILIEQDNPAAVTITRNINGQDYEIELSQNEAAQIWTAVRLEEIREDVKYRIECRQEVEGSSIENVTFTDQMIDDIAERFSDANETESYWLQLDAFIDDAAMKQKEYKYNKDVPESADEDEYDRTPVWRDKQDWQDVIDGEDEDYDMEM